MNRKGTGRYLVALMLPIGLGLLLRSTPADAAFVWFAQVQAYNILGGISVVGFADSITNSVADSFILTQVTTSAELHGPFGSPIYSPIVVQFVHFGDSQTETPAWTSPVDLPTGSCPAPYTYTAFGNHSFSYITGNVEVERSGYSWPIH